MLWVTHQEVRKVWKSAPADDDVLEFYLQSVAPAIVAYAPTPTVAPAPLAPADWPKPTPDPALAGQWIVYTQAGAVAAKILNPNAEWHHYWFGTPLDPAAPIDWLEESDVPEAWKLALIMQARSVYNAGQARAGGSEFGNEDFSISIYPLDWQVKQLLRPIRGLGAIA